MALEPWIRIGQPLEPVMEDYPRVFDAWEAGGIRGLVFGRLTFADEDGNFTIPALPAKPEAFRERGIEVEEDVLPADAAKEKLLHEMLDDAKSRGWTVMIFSPAGRTRAKSLPIEEDPYGATLMAATWDEVFSSFTQVDGGILDGWTESAYELRFHHGGAVFADMSAAERAKAVVRGNDVERLERGMHHLRDRFHSFTPAEVGYYGAHGVLSEMNLFDINEDAVHWLRWRREDGIKTGQAVRKELNKLARRPLLANGPRSAVFSGMTALDFLAWDEIVDFLLVKHYFWHRGFDGLYGTVFRWVKQVQDWNPSLSETDCFTVVKAWLGVDLPEVNTLPDMELGFPQAFFDQVVQEETRRAVAAVSDPGKILPWVDTGRMPHGGDPMTAGDLYRILVASEEAGLERFLFHNHEHLTSAEWSVISQMCGTKWNEDPEGYWPPNTPRPSTY